MHVSRRRNYTFYVCSRGCGHSEIGGTWHSPPYGRDGDLRCPDCGSLVWPYRDLTKAEALARLEEGDRDIQRFYV